MSDSEFKQRVNSYDLVKFYEELKQNGFDLSQLSNIYQMLTVNKPLLANLKNSILQLQISDIYELLRSSRTNSSNEVILNSQIASLQDEINKKNIERQRLERALNDQQEHYKKSEEKKNKSLTASICLKDEQIKENESKINALETANKRISQEIQGKDQKIFQLETNTKDYEETIKTLRQTISTKDSELINSQMENNNVREESKQKSNQLRDRELELSNVKNEMESLSEVLSQIESKNKQFESSSQALNNTNQQLENKLKVSLQENEMQFNEINNYEQQISEFLALLKQSQEKYSHLQQELEKILSENHELKTEKDKMNAIVPFRKESEYGYDITIIMKSLKDLCLKPQEDLNQGYAGGVRIQNPNNLDFNFKNVILVGMQGERNKGKTFILNSLVNEDYPSDYHLSTPGICIKHQKVNNKNTIYIDSEGLRCPIKLNYEHNQHYQNFMHNKLEEGKVDHKSKQLLSLDIQQTHEEVKATEQLQQEFIIENSNIIIVVVSQLTVDDQRLIHQIQERVCNKKDSTKEKRIIIVHNLVELKQSAYVKRYIEEDLKNIYPLEEQSQNEYKKDYEDENSVIFIDQINPELNHIILGCQGTDAGRVYNKFAFYYLRQVIEMYQGVSNLNVPMKLKEYLNKHLDSFVILNEENGENSKDISQKDLISLSDKNTLLHLKPGLQIQKFKELQLNVFGGINNDLKSSILEQNKNKLVLIVEAPGAVEIKRKFDQINGVFFINITQNQSIEDQFGTIQQTTRKFELTKHQIQICKKDELWSLVSTKENESLQNGCYKYVFHKQELDEYD